MKHEEPFLSTPHIPQACKCRGDRGEPGAPGENERGPRGPRGVKGQKGERGKDLTLSNN